MIIFFENPSNTVYGVQTLLELGDEDIKKLNWLFGQARPLYTERVDRYFVGPRAAMVTPWSTNAVEVTQNMGIEGIIRVEEFQSVSPDFTDFDPMISQKYAQLDQDIYQINISPEPIQTIDDIAAYNDSEGLALNAE